MKHTIPSIILGAAALLVTACKNDTAKEQTEATTTNEIITITHALGTVEVPKNPQRIAVLDYASLEALEYLDLKVVAMPKANLPKHLAAYKNDASIIDIGTVKEIDFEKLNEVDPDVIFMSGRTQDAYAELSKIAPTLYTEIDYTNYMTSLGKNLAIFGDLFDKKEETAIFLNKLNEQITSVREKIQETNKKALVVLHNNGRFSAYGKGSRFGMIHDVLGMPEAVENLEAARHGQTISNEFIQEANPDYLYIIDRTVVVDGTATNKEAIENRLIQQTNAYKKGKIIYLDSEIWYLAGGGVNSIKRMISEIEESL